MGYNEGLAGAPANTHGGPDPFLCPHFGECGGCAFQDVPYEEQLAHKEAQLRTLFDAFWGGAIPVAPSPDIWHYRNKVDFSFGRKRYPEPPPKGFERETVVGFRRKGKWYWPLDIAECRIGPEGTSSLLDGVRAWLRAEGLRAFDSRQKEGLLKALLVRVGVRSGQRMVALITGDGAFNKTSFVETVASTYPADSLWHAVYRGMAVIAFGEELDLLHGVPSIEEHLEVPDDSGVRRLRFRISPFSFFQTNTLAAETLYGAIRAWVRQVSPSILYDLYGGSGGIALSCADLVDNVVSVESVATATEDGRYNAAANGVENVRFEHQEMRHYLRETRDEGGLPSGHAVIVDPPRAGLHPKALRRLIELRPAHLLYVSCKPTVLASELPALLDTHRLVGLQAVDMFPHTGHVEVLARLELRQDA